MPLSTRMTLGTVLLALGVKTAVYTSGLLVLWIRLAMLPPVTLTSAVVKSVLASLRVKVMVLVCPARSAVLSALMAMVGGTLVALLMGKNDPGFVHNGPLAGLVAVCAGSDVMHPMGALVVGAVAGAIFVVMFTLTQNKWRIDDVLGVWPLHGLCGTWGGIAAGVFGTTAFGGLGGVNVWAQLAGTALGVCWALVSGFVVYGVLKISVGLRLSQEEEFEGADLTIHKISGTPEREVSW